jgi:transposase-like protein
MLEQIPPAAPPPDPEVAAHPAKRLFSAEEKKRILSEADACSEPGQISALLRREGIYSSYLTAWRLALAEGGEEALKGKKTGRKPTAETQREIEQLQQKVAALEEKLQRANHIIEAQKKVSCLLAEALGNSQSA